MMTSSSLVKDFVSVDYINPTTIHKM